MSNQAYGYICFENISYFTKLKEHIERKYSVGIFEIERTHLHGFPLRIQPKPEDNVKYIAIGDSPENSDASFLLSDFDYADSIGIALPLKAFERKKMMADLVYEISKFNGVNKIGIALTDMNQVEDIKTVDESELFNVLLNDFYEYYPPDCLYIIKKEKRN